MTPADRNTRAAAYALVRDCGDILTGAVDLGMLERRLAEVIGEAFEEGRRDGAASSMPDFATGVGFVPRRGLVKVHDGCSYPPRADPPGCRDSHGVTVNFHTSDGIPPAVIDQIVSELHRTGLSRRRPTTTDAPSVAPIDVDDLIATIQTGIGHHDEGLIRDAEEALQRVRTVVEAARTLIEEGPLLDRLNDIDWYACCEEEWGGPHASRCQWERLRVALGVQA